MRRVFESMYKKTKRYLDYLVRSFTGAIRLQVVGRDVKQLYTELFEERSPKLTKEFRVSVGY